MSGLVYAGIDLGFGNIKATADGDNFIVEPSIVGTPPVMRTGYDTTAGISIVRGTTLYYVGSKALSDTTDANYTFIADKTERDDNDMTKYYACLGYCMGDAATATFRVGTGLPVFEFATIKDLLARKLSGHHEFEYNGKKRWVDVAHVDVMPQGAGSFYDQTLDELGNIHSRYVGMLNSRTLILEFGFRTTEVVTMEFGKFRGHPMSLTVEHGMSRVHNDVRMLLKQREGLTLKMPEVDAIVCSGGYQLHGGKFVNIQSEIKAYEAKAWQYILQDIQMSIPNYSKYYNHVILSGGGALNFWPYVQREFGAEVARLHRRAQVTAPMVANAAGYRKRSLFLAHNGR